MRWPLLCQGRLISEDELEWLRPWITAHPQWSRKRLALELCRLWQWRDALGRLKDFAARSFLLKLAARGLIDLPVLQVNKRRVAPTARCVPEVDCQQEQLCAALEELQPVALEPVAAGSDKARRMAFYLNRFHYLGWRVVGENMAYLARDGSGRDLGVLLFGAAAWRCAPRERHLGWKEAERRAQLARVAIIPAF